MQAFMAHCAATLGSNFFLTPRDAVKTFVGLLSVIEQNPGTNWRTLLSNTTVEQTADPEGETVAPDVEAATAHDDDLAAFQL
jgi:hypothetical protein